VLVSGGGALQGTGDSSGMNPGPGHCGRLREVFDLIEGRPKVEHALAVLRIVRIEAAVQRQGTCVLLIFHIETSCSVSFRAHGAAVRSA